ncbi:MAG: ComEC/Rec2 family competence protein, partial [Polynucleobacter sp.]
MPELPKEGIVFFVGITLALTIAWFSLRKTQVQLSGFCLLLALFIFGWTYSFQYADSRLTKPFPAELENQEIRVSGYIDQLPNGDEQGQRFSFRVSSWDEQDSKDLPERIYLSWSNAWHKKMVIPNLIPGQEWEFLVKLKRPHSLINPHQFDFERWMFHQGFGAYGSVRSGELLSDSIRLSNFKTAIEYQRWRIRTKIRNILGKDAQYVGVLIALVIGDQNAIAQEDWRVFNATGVGHLISISGLHVTMLSGLGAALGAWLWRRRQLPLSVPVQKIAACTGFLTAFLYAWLAGFQIPAQRTMYMVGVVAFALWTGRIARAFDIWWLALLLVLIMDPMAAYTPGFWLSFGAVAVILYGMGASSSLIGIPNGKEYEKDRSERLILALKESCRLQWIVTIALLPCTLYWFYQVSIASPIANALAIPIISFVVTPLAIAGALLPESLSHPLLHLAHFA